MIDRRRSELEDGAAQRRTIGAAVLGRFVLTEIGMADSTFIRLRFLMLAAISTITTQSTRCSSAHFW